MKRTPINPISKKKAEQMMVEYPVRKALAERCGGIWVFTHHLTYRTRDKKQTWLIPQGYCKGGRCEVCGGVPTGPDFRLHPHEKVFRSRGGKMTLENSVMSCNQCHNREHGIKVVE